MPIWDILLPLPEGYHGNCEHIQAIIEVFPELAFFNFIFQIFIRGSDNSDVHGCHFCPANPHDRFVSITLSRAACNSRGISPISSRKIVPPVGQFKFPLIAPLSGA